MLEKGFLLRLVRGLGSWREEDDLLNGVFLRLFSSFPFSCSSLLLSLPPRSPFLFKYFKCILIRFYPLFKCKSIYKCPK